MKQRFLIVLVIIFLVQACSKKSDVPHAPEAIEPRSSFTLGYYSKIAPLNEFELIVQDTLGKKILDTIVTLNSSLNLNLKTADKEFNITTIINYTRINKYFINTYLNVSFDKWNMVSTIDLAT